MNRSFRPRRKHESKPHWPKPMPACLFLTMTCLNGLRIYPARMHWLWRTSRERSNSRRAYLLSGISRSRRARGPALASARHRSRAAPVFTPRMPRTGKAFSVRMTNCGRIGLGLGSRARLSLSGDASANRRAVAGFSAETLAAPGKTSAATRTPEACLMNYYASVRGWVCIRIAMRRILPRRSSRCRWATLVSFASAAQSAAARPARSSCLRRRDGARRRSASRLSRRRPHFVRDVHAAAARRPVYNLTLRRVTKPRSRTSRSAPRLEGGLRTRRCAVREPFGPPFDTPTFAGRSSGRRSRSRSR